MTPYNTNLYYVSTETNPGRDLPIVPDAFSITRPAISHKSK